MKFENQNIVITGGSSGIGKAIAIQCAEKGANVIILARRKPLLDSALIEIKTHKIKGNQQFSSYSLDISDDKAVEKWTSDFIKDFGRCDILINNAGIAVCDHFEKTSLDDFKKVMFVDYYGVVNMTRSVVPLMKTNRRGHIVNISSVLGFMGVYGYSAYCPAKFAVSAFSEVLRFELDKYNIKISLVFPPDVDTPQAEMCNTTMPEATKYLSGFAKLLTAEEAAKKIIRAVEKEKYIINLNFMGKVIYILNRWFPSIISMVSFSTIRKSENKIQKNEV